MVLSSFDVLQMSILRLIAICLDLRGRWFGVPTSKDTHRRWMVRFWGCCLLDSVFILEKSFDRRVWMGTTDGSLSMALIFSAMVGILSESSSVAGIWNSTAPLTVMAFGWLPLVDNG